MDSTLIDLCISLYDWAHYQTKKGAIKLHCMLDLKSDLPIRVFDTDGKKSEYNHCQDFQSSTFSGQHICV